MGCFEQRFDAFRHLPDERQLVHGYVRSRIRVSRHSHTDGSVGGTVTAGTQANLVYASTFNVGNSKVYLKGINFHVIGSANKGDIRNLKLVVNGTQVGATLPTVNQDGTAYFDASAAPGVLNTGNNNVQVFADVMGSPSYNFQFEVLNGYDVLALDSQYNVPVQPIPTPALVTIQQGQITVTQDATTPSGTSLSKGQASVVLAKFDIYAAGEAVKILYLAVPDCLSGGNDDACRTRSRTLRSLMTRVVRWVQPSTSRVQRRR